MVSGTAVVALLAGLSAAVAVESEQVRPHVLQVQRHGPPGPALIEKLESTTSVQTAAARRVDDLGTTVSDICTSAARSRLITPEAIVCALSGRAGTLLESLLGELDG